MKPYKSIYKEAHYFTADSNEQFKVTLEDLVDFLEEQIDINLKKLENKKVSSKDIYFKGSFSYKEIYMKLNVKNKLSEYDLEEDDYKSILSNINLNDIGKELSKRYSMAGWKTSNIAVYNTALDNTPVPYIQLSVSLEQ
jgi:tRNA G37 N-methylase Trm5